MNRVLPLVLLTLAMVSILGVLPSVLPSAHAQVGPGTLVAFKSITFPTSCTKFADNGGCFLGSANGPLGFQDCCYGGSWTFPVGVAVGDTLVASDLDGNAEIAGSGSLYSTSCSDSLGNSWTKVVFGGGSQGGGLLCWTVSTGSSANDFVTVDAHCPAQNCSGGGDRFLAVVVDYTGSLGVGTGPFFSTSPGTPTTITTTEYTVSKGSAFVQFATGFGVGQTCPQLSLVQVPGNLPYRARQCGGQPGGDTNGPDAFVADGVSATVQTSNSGASMTIATAVLELTGPTPSGGPSPGPSVINGCDSGSGTGSATSQAGSCFGLGLNRGSVNIRTNGTVTLTVAKGDVLVAYASDAEGFCSHPIASGGNAAVSGWATVNVAGCGLAYTFSEFWTTVTAPGQYSMFMSQGDPTNNSWDYAMFQFSYATSVLAKGVPTMVSRSSCSTPSGCSAYNDPLTNTNAADLLLCGWGSSNFGNISDQPPTGQSNAGLGPGGGQGSQGQPPLVLDLKTSPNPAASTSCGLNWNGAAPTAPVGQVSSELVSPMSFSYTTNPSPFHTRALISGNVATIPVTVSYLGGVDSLASTTCTALTAGTSCTITSCDPAGSACAASLVVNYGAALTSVYAINGTSAGGGYASGAVTVLIDPLGPVTNNYLSAANIAAGMLKVILILYVAVVVLNLLYGRKIVKLASRGLVTILYVGIVVLVILAFAGNLGGA